MSESIFVRDGNLFVPTELARGPWSPEAQHGGAPAALLAHLVERAEGGDNLFVSRLTVELLRPVPIAPLTARTRIPAARYSWWKPPFSRRRRGHAVHGAAHPPGRHDPAGQSAAVASPPAPEVGVAGMPPWAASVGYRALHSVGVEHRFASGSFEHPGEAVD